MNRGEGFDGFDFNDDFVLDEEVGTEAVLHAQGVVDDRDGVLGQNAEAAPGEFPGEGGFVNGLEETWTEGGVNAESGVDDVAGDFVFGR